MQHLVQKSIVILTSRELSKGSPDDQIFMEALRNKGLQVKNVIWDETAPSDLLKSSMVIWRSPWDYHQKIELILEWLKKAETLSINCFNPPSLVLWNISKKYLLDIGVKSVPTVFLKRCSQKTFIEEVKKHSWQTIVIKPEISASAFKTFKLQTSEIANHWSQISSIWDQCEVLVQPFCDSVEIDGEYSLIFFNDKVKPQFSHAVLKRPKQKEFRVQAEFGGTVESFLASETLRAFSRKAVESIKHDWLYARVDVVKYQEDYVLGELELFEPQLFFKMDSEAATRLVDCISRRLAGQ